MAAPNIVNVQTITGTSIATSLATTSATAVVSNAAGSGTLLKVNTVIISNISGTNAGTYSLFFNTAAAGAGSNFALASTISVPANATLISMDRSTAVYIPENTSLVIQAGTANILNVVVSYEIIS